MNWRREAIDKLRNYEAHKLALESLPKEIRRLESSFAGIRSATTDGTPVARGLGLLDDEERQVIERLFIHPMKGAMALLSEQLDIDKTTVYRRRDNALRRFTIALYGAVESE